MAPHFASELWSGFTNVPRLELTQRNYGSKNLVSYSIIFEIIFLFEYKICKCIIKSS